MQRVRSIKPNFKYEIICSIKNYPVFQMCKIAKVSKSGYYKWLKNKDKISMQKILDNVLVKEVFIRKKGKYGIRRIKMDLEENRGIIMNKKKISKIMKEQGLKTKVRIKSPCKEQVKDVFADYYCDNILMQNFKNRQPYEAFGIDITYLKYNNKFGYLCTLIDVKTTEIISYGISDNLKVDFVLGTIKYGIAELPKEKIENLIIHSDRGSHFRAKKYKELLEENHIIQSMSLPGNPKDNAVVESFFGHLKDEINLKNVKTFEQLVEIIDNYMYYYNNKRKQWNKNRMTPIQYRDFLLAS